MTASKARVAQLYRMVMPDHVCPWGLKARDLLRRKGFEVEDHPLTSRAETDAFKAEHGVKTTPQTFIGGERVGGYDDLRRALGRHVRDPDAPRYTPVLAVFATAALMAAAVGLAVDATPLTLATVRRAVAFAMCLLAMLKLQDVESFSSMFLNYDLLARRWVPYASLYPFLELGAGVLMAAGVLTWLSAPVAGVIGAVGAVSVVKAVYVDRRELKCACVGGGSRVPLGFVSLTENLMMMVMAVWMAAKALTGA